MEEIEAHVILYEDEQPQARAERWFRERVTTESELQFNDAQFQDRYRVTKEIFYDLLRRFKLSAHCNKTKRSNAVQNGIMVLLTLRYFANGLPMRDVGDLYHLHKTTAGRAIKRVIAFLLELMPEYITFPLTRKQLHDNALGFSKIDGFPNIMGAIDGTHIVIVAPNEEEAAYVDKNNNHSLNCQIVCNADLMILDIDPTWPGSAHDAYILKKSELYRLCEAKPPRFGNYKLLGDSGYGCKPWLMTPYNGPTEPHKIRYNTSHKKTRCTVERCIGVLKSRWRVLSKHGGLLEMMPEHAANAVCACAVLHNICTRARLAEPDIVVEDPYDDPPPPGDCGRGSDIRDNIAKLAFSKKKAGAAQAQAAANTS